VTQKSYSNTAVNPNVYLGYDLTGRALHARFGGAAGPGVTNTYDPLGRVKTTTDSNIPTAAPCNTPTTPSGTAPS
jgi:hypothetical protein